MRWPLHQVVQTYSNTAGQVSDEVAAASNCTVARGITRSQKHTRELVALMADSDPLSYIPRSA